MPDELVNSVMSKLQRRIAQILAEERPPGLAVGIVRDQELQWCHGYGLADIESGRPVNEHTLFLVASISKTFTATAIMRLRDEGKLRLDDPVTRFIPEFESVLNPFGPIHDVTLLRLLTHRSGLIGESPTGHWTTTRFPTREEVLASIPKLKIAIEPDSEFKYSNLAFALLGEVVSRVSGRSFAEYVENTILRPLEMRTSTFLLTPAARELMATGYLPHPYDDVPEQSQVPDDFGGYNSAAGLRSSVVDLAKWLSLQFRTKAPKTADNQVIGGGSLSSMHRVRWVERDWITGYAMTWWATRIGENIYHHHTGGDHGFLTVVVFNKRHRIGAIALSNGTGHLATGRVAFEAMEVLTAAVRESSMPPATNLVATPAASRGYLGAYVPMHFGGEVRIEYRSGSLALVAPPIPGMPPPPPPIPLNPTDRANIFLATRGRPAGEELVFEMSLSGEAVGFTLGELKYVRR